MSFPLIDSSPAMEYNDTLMPLAWCQKSVGLKKGKSTRIFTINKHLNNFIGPKAVSFFFDAYVGLGATP